MLKALIQKNFFRSGHFLIKLMRKALFTRVS